MRDYALLAIIIGLVPVILMRPWIGILAWFWVGLMAPHGLTWSFMRTFPIATMIGAATLVALLLARDRRPLPRSPEMGMMFAWAGFVTLTSAFAVNPTGAWDFWWHLMKILLITFITPILIFGERRIALLLLVITFSIAFYGVKGGIFAVSTGGNYSVLGPPGSYLSGNTYIGLAMIMILPLVLASARMFYRGWVDFGWPSLRPYMKPVGLGFYAAFWLTAIAIMATYSRGAFLGLIAVAPLLFFHMRWKAVMIAAAVFAVGAVGVAAPERLMDRWKTIETYEEDTSAMQRIQAWEVNWNMAVERPLVGMGFRNAGLGYDWWIQYAGFEGRWEHVLSPHSIYFSVLGHHGFVGLFVFLALIGATLLTLNRVRRIARERPHQRWLSEYAWALQVGLFGYLVSGTFLDVAYFDLLYAFVALAIIMRRELDEATEPVPAAEAGPRESAPLRFPDFVATATPSRGGDQRN